MSSTTVAKHVKRLRAAHLSEQDIARYAGISQPLVAMILTGAKTVVSATTAASLLTVDFTVALTPVGATRRLRALAAQGWSMRLIAARTNVTHQALSYAVNGDRDLTLPVRQTVAQAFEDLKDVDPHTVSSATSVRQAKANAKEKGWPLPWRWEGILIDDPKVKPLAMPSKRESISLELSEMEYLATAGETWEVACARIFPGMSPTSVRTHLYKFGGGSIRRLFTHEAPILSDNQSSSSGADLSENNMDESHRSNNSVDTNDSCYDGGAR